MVCSSVAAFRWRAGRGSSSGCEMVPSGLNIDEALAANVMGCSRQQQLFGGEQVVDRRFSLRSDEPYTCLMPAIGVRDLNYPSITVPHLVDTVTVVRTVKNVGSPGVYRLRVKEPAPSLLPRCCNPSPKRSQPPSLQPLAGNIHRCFLVSGCLVAAIQA